MRLEEWPFNLETWGDVAFDDPPAGTRYAKRALASSEDLGRPPEIYATALTISAVDSMMTGHLERAESFYLEALEVFEAIPREPRHPILILQAHHLRNFAYLRAKQLRYSDAFVLVDKAELIYACVGDDHGFGRALLARGTIHLLQDDPAAVFSLSAALRYLDTEGSKHYLPAVHNLILALTYFSELDPPILESSLQFLIEARLSLRSWRRDPKTRYLGGRRRRVPGDAYLRYLQGRILVLLGAHDQARPLLESAREDFVHLGMVRDAAAAALELAECALWLSGKHRWNRVLKLCSEVLAALRAEPNSTDAVAAYQLLELAARERSLEDLETAIAQSREVFSLA